MLRQPGWPYKLVEYLLDCAAPVECAGCGGRAAIERPFCVACLRSVGPIPAPENLEGLPLTTVGAFDGAVAECIRGLKYRNRYEWARPLGIWTACRLSQSLHSTDSGVCFVPVPLHGRRLAERGYNQAALLAKAAAARLGLTSKPRALSRYRDTPQQANLDRRARLANVRNAFELRGRYASLDAIVFDDVVTTGATALACADALRSAGITVRGVVAVARAK